jgi:hypothetical protein
MVMKWLIQWIKSKWTNYKKRKDFERKLKELRKRDPFIYNH